MVEHLESRTSKVSRHIREITSPIISRFLIEYKTITQYQNIKMYEPHNYFEEAKFPYKEN